MKAAALFVLVTLGVASAACGGDGAASRRSEASEDELTSLTARSREVKFEGVVYVDPRAGERTILEQARKQSRTAFGALLAVDVAVEDREVREIDPRTFKKREVKVFDTDNPDDRGKTKLEVRYTYNDMGVVPIALARRTALPLALLGPDYDSHQTQVVEECTKNDREAREDADAGLLWYNFNPSKASCKQAIVREQKKVEADRAKLADPRNHVTLSQVNRVYLPATISLGSAETARGATYPEYDKLFSGGVEENKLVIGLISGRLNHHHTEAALEDGYYEWMDSLGVLFKEHPGFKLTKIDPAEDITTVTVAGRRITGLSFADFIQWTVYDTGYPAGLTAAQKKELKSKIGNKLDNKWVTFELPTKVRVGRDGQEKDFTVVLNTSFGADEDPAPHKRAVRTSDVFIYNGHSYIGEGPLDPANFRPSDFPSSYQLFFIDGCVSYNYYNEGYFLLKQGGTENLDTITNAIEAPSYDSGAAEGRMLARLIRGNASYRTLLEAAKSTDSLRVVDGETDNEYAPSETPIRVEAR